MDPAEAEELARHHLMNALPRRWRHVQAVAKFAHEISHLVGDCSTVLVSAAWLHDIGYAPDISETDFHPLDGARYLQTVGIEYQICALVANHTGALVEAELRSLRAALSTEFPYEESETSDALWYTDLTTGPDGQTLSVDERLREIRTRYGPKHVVTRFVDLAEPSLRAAVHRTKARMATRSQKSDRTKE
jgi:HD domain-containing protein